MKADGSRASAGEYRGPKKGCSGTIIDPCGANEIKGHLLITTLALMTPPESVKCIQHLENKLFCSAHKQFR